MAGAQGAHLLQPRGAGLRDPHHPLHHWPGLRVRPADPSDVQRMSDPTAPDLVEDEVVDEVVADEVIDEAAADRAAQGEAEDARIPTPEVEPPADGTEEDPAPLPDAAALAPEDVSADM